MPGPQLRLRTRRCARIEDGASRCHPELSYYAGYLVPDPDLLQNVITCEIGDVAAMRRAGFDYGKHVRTQHSGVRGEEASLPRLDLLLIVRIGKTEYGFVCTEPIARCCAMQAQHLLRFMKEQQTKASPLEIG